VRFGSSPGVSPSPVENRRGQPRSRLAALGGRSAVPTRISGGSRGDSGRRRCRCNRLAVAEPDQRRQRLLAPRRRLKLVGAPPCVLRRSDRFPPHSPIPRVMSPHRDARSSGGVWVVTSGPAGRKTSSQACSNAIPSAWCAASAARMSPGGHVFRFPDTPRQTRRRLVGAGAGGREPGSGPRPRRRSRRGGSRRRTAGRAL
jgi:hypothetical protein